MKEGLVKKGGNNDPPTTPKKNIKPPAQKPANKKQITISLKEYCNLKDRSLELSALEAAGVDNWVGCDNAWELLREWKEEDND